MQQYVYIYDAQVCCGLEKRHEKWKKGTTLYVYTCESAGREAKKSAAARARCGKKEERGEKERERETARRDCRGRRLLPAVRARVSPVDTQATFSRELLLRVYIHTYS